MLQQLNVVGDSCESTLVLKVSEQCFTSPPTQYIGYTGDGFYRSKDPTNSIKVLKEDLQKTKQTTKTTKYRYT